MPLPLRHPEWSTARHMTSRFAATFAPSGIALLASLPGCTTPSTTLRNPRTGQVATCGGNVSGSLAGGMVGYNIQKNSDQRCVAEYTRLGFVPVR